MADALYIDATQVKKGAANFKQLIEKLPQKVDDELNQSALTIVEQAKQNAPANTGILKGAISAENKPLLKRITVNAPYAAYIEFGTGKYAAEQVSKYPAEYREFAQQFKGPAGHGSFKDFLRVLTEWVRLKQITGTYSVKTQRRTGSKSVQQIQNEQAAYLIARSILKNGVHPHPFLIPALINESGRLIKRLKTMLSNLHV